MIKSDVTSAPSVGAAAGYSSSTRLMLWTLLAIFILNFLDRQIVTILAEPIKRELGLSDTQIGLMTGLAFALFYAVLGLPLARWADRPSSNRVTLIRISLAIWSAMTALCGLAQNFTQLLLARVGVGVGEAGCTPAAHSLITDTVPRERRSSAIAFYGLGIPIGGLLGMVIGGSLNDAFGWRVAFLAVGIPGILIAVLLPFILREPRRQSTANMAAESAENTALPVGAALREMAASRGFVLVVIAASLTAFLSYGKGVWVVILFQRSHGLSPGETGLLLGVVLGLSGIAGTWLGGWAADRFGRVNRRHILTAPAVLMTLATPLLFLAYWASDWRVALALLVLPTIFNSAYYGPAYACAQGLVRPR